jgi:hypothetical protein
VSAKVRSLGWYSAETEDEMDRGVNLASATLVVGLVTLALVTVLMFRPAPTAEDAVPAVASLRADVTGLRDDIAQLRQMVEESTSGGPADLSAIEDRLDGLESQLTRISSNVDAMNATALTICQLVVDSPFVPDGSC